MKTHQFPFLILLAVMISGCFIACDGEGGYAYKAERGDMAASAEDYVVLERNTADEGNSTEEYAHLDENRFLDPATEPISTFSIDVDNASYSNVRRFLEDNQLPPADAVRIEEMVNYFTYDYPQPTGNHPFALVTEVADCPWKAGNKLVHIGIQGQSLDYDDLKPSNLVFLIDASGSMEAENKLPLLKHSLRMLLDELGTEDRVSIVAYAGASGLVLPPTSATERSRILGALDGIQAGGSTAGAGAIQHAYAVAQSVQKPGENNRVILCTDGDFNVGASSPAELVRIIQEERKKGIYLTICGFGMGNLKDNQMEQLSNAGNGNYFYIDNIKEAEKVFVKEMRANLFTIAKDVKIQVAFNPDFVAKYRLIGYENRMLATEDFDNDLKDAGELGAGHSVTALYEVVPQLLANGDKSAKGAKVNKNGEPQTAATDMLALKLRYKPIDSEESILIETGLPDADVPLAHTTVDFRFAAAVAGFGMLLQNSAQKGDLTYAAVLELANSSTAYDPHGYRQEFISMVKTASLLSE